MVLQSYVQILPFVHHPYSLRIRSPNSSDFGPKPDEPPGLFVKFNCAAKLCTDLAFCTPPSLGIRSPNSSDFGRKSDDSAHLILKSKKGIGIQSSQNVTEQILAQQQYEVHTDARVAIDALDYEYNHDTRTQSPRLSAARLQLAVGRRGFGPTTID